MITRDAGDSPPDGRPGLPRSEDVNGGGVQLVVGVFDRFGDVPAPVVHGDPGPGNIRIAADGRVGVLDWDEARFDLIWHDVSNFGVQMLDDAEHGRSQDLSNAWEAVNASTTEPDYAMERLRRLDPSGT